MAVVEKRDPFTVLTYGYSGIGKTTDMGYSFPTGLFIAAPGALNSLRSVCGFIPANINISTLHEATKLIQQIGKDQSFPTVIFDDFSYLAERTFAEYEKKYKGFALFGAFRDAALELRNVARSCGTNVVFNAWEQGPKMKDGARIRGGPQLPGKLPEAIPALCDMVLRAGFDSERKPWGGVYRCNGNPDYVTKDRYDTARICDPAPMNLGELLRASNFTIARHPAFTQQEELVENFAQSRLQLPPQADIMAWANQSYSQLLAAGLDPAQSKWTMRDAMDRALIRKQVLAASSVFIS